LGGVCSTYGGDERDAYRILVMKGTDHFEDPGIDGRIIFEKEIWKKGEMVWTSLIWLRIGTGGGFLGVLHALV
jgi:hypothetical protein